MQVDSLKRLQVGMEDGREGSLHAVGVMRRTGAACVGVRQAWGRAPGRGSSAWHGVSVLGMAVSAEAMICAPQADDQGRQLGKGVGAALRLGLLCRSGSAGLEATVEIYKSSIAIVLTRLIP